MNESDAQAHVRASAALLGLTLDDAQIARVAVFLGASAGMARMLEQLDLPVTLEQAQIFCPTETSTHATSTGEGKTP